MNNETSIRPKYNSVLILYFLLVLVPLSISSYFASYTDLVKSSVVKIGGGVYLILMSYELYRYSKREIIRISLKVPDILVLTFFTILLLSTIFSVNPEISFTGQYYRHIGFLLYIYLVLMYFFLSYNVNENNANKIFRLVEFTAFLVSLYSLFQVLSLDFFSLQPPDQKRPVSTIGSLSRRIPSLHFTFFSFKSF